MPGWNVYQNEWDDSEIDKDSLSRLLIDMEHERSAKAKFIDTLIGKGTESWWFPEFEDFLQNYPSADRFQLYFDFDDVHIGLYTIKKDLIVKISSPDKATIEKTRVQIAAMVKKRPNVEPTIFIGHGKDGQWRLLKDHLHDIHKYQIEAYEIGPRAGLSIKEVLSKMLKRSSFALLVLTGEDEYTDGSLHARENVIHEIGLFQGRLGFDNAIVLLEGGVSEFSNILGINQIRFSKGNIKETFGDVIGVLRDRFGE